MRLKLLHGDADNASKGYDTDRRSVSGGIVLWEGWGVCVLVFKDSEA